MSIKAYSYIRFSRPDQIKGNSLERQKELSLAYCEKNNITLDTSINLHDLGVSAFKGANAEQGALGAFIAAVKLGKIKKGSILLIESLDRLSREKVPKALKLFLEILEQDIKIVTLSDQVEYDIKNLNTNELIISISIMSRAHEESLSKSKRIRAAYRKKRENITEKKLTSQCPAWLTLDKKTQAFTPIPEKLKAVKLIFELSAGGMGSYSIIKELSKRNIPPIGRTKKNEWYQSYISKILNGRAVLGELISNSKDGQQIFTDYYPQVIDKDLYYKAKQGIESRSKKSGGRKGKYLTNLFSKIIYCGHSKVFEGGIKCNSRDVAMVVVNKGKHSYIQCHSSKMGNNTCKELSRLWRYDAFEKSILTSITELDASTLFGNNNSETLIQNLDTIITTLQGELEDTNKKIDNLIELQMSGDTNGNRHSTSVANKILELEAEQLTIENSLKENKLLLEAGKSNPSPATNSKRMASFVSEMNSLDKEKLYIVRLKLSELLKSSIERIDVYPNGLKTPPLSTDKKSPKASKPYFLAIIYFKSGNKKQIISAKADRNNFTSVHMSTEEQKRHGLI